MRSVIVTFEMSNEIFIFSDVMFHYAQWFHLCVVVSQHTVQVFTHILVFLLHICTASSTLLNVLCVWSTNRTTCSRMGSFVKCVSVWNNRLIIIEPDNLRPPLTSPLSKHMRSSENAWKILMVLISCLQFNWFHLHVFFLFWMSGI